MSCSCYQTAHAELCRISLDLQFVDDHLLRHCHAVGSNRIKLPLIGVRAILEQQGLGRGREPVGRDFLVDDGLAADYELGRVVQHFVVGFRAFCTYYGIKQVFGAVDGHFFVKSLLFHRLGHEFLVDDLVCVTDGVVLTLERAVAGEDAVVNAFDEDYFFKGVITFDRIQKCFIADVTE